MLNGSDLKTWLDGLDSYDLNKPVIIPIGSAGYQLMAVQVQVGRLVMVPSGEEIPADPDYVGEDDGA